MKRAYQKILIAITFTLISQEFAVAGGEVVRHPSVAAVHTDKPPTLDGHFDPEEWKGAAVIDNFTQVQPQEGGVPSQKTVVHILYDAEHLYFGIQCFETDPTKIIAQQMQREVDISSDDTVEIVLDSFADKKNGYYFAMSAAGAKVDGLVEQAGLNTLWDGIWIGKVETTGEGWTAEFAIPFNTISLKESATSWGVNIQRTINRNQEIVRWSGPSQNENFLDMIQAGTLTNLVGLKQGIGLTLKPYSSIFVDFNDGYTFVRPGGDLIYKLSPATTAIITVNTDFADAEIDALQVNTSRFSLFYPEKRSFFLQDTTVFSFGGINQSPLPFYSRTIGLVNGRRKDVFAGVKVTGREGFMNFGILDVQMVDDPDLGSKNLGVARALANVFDQSTAGVIITHGDPGTTGSNTLYGADFNYQNSHLFGNNKLRASVWAMGTHSTSGPANSNVSSGSNTDDYALGALLSYPNDTVALTAYAARYGTNFNPALGFIQRPGTWEFDFNPRYRWRTPGFFRQIDVSVSTIIFLLVDGSIQTVSLHAPALTVVNQFGDNLYIEGRYIREVLTESFVFLGTETLQAGTYDFGFVDFNVASSSNRAISGSISGTIGRIWNGFFIDGSIGLTWNVDKHFNISANYYQAQANTYPNAASLKIFIANANVILLPNLYWNTIVQWDDYSKTAGLNSRLRWEITPGQVAYLVINQGFNVDDRLRFTKRDGNLTLKLAMNILF